MKNVPLHKKEAMKKGKKTTKKGKKC